MVMRGGSSKGAFFVKSDIPTSDSERDELLLRVMGSPDARQIDGIGGAHPLTSKVAIVGPSEDDQADLEYLFLQLGVDSDVVTDRQNCGNLLAGVGPFALERGLISVDPHAQTAAVRIRMLNTDSIAIATFQTTDGNPRYDGATAISGVPGAGSPIQLDFLEIAGGTSGSLLPTGAVVDTIADVQCTLIDNGMPVVVIKAEAMGISGYESCAELEANDSLCKKLEQIRLKAGRLMNLGDVAGLSIPKLTMVAKPQHGGDLSTRTFIPHRCHDAIGVLGAVSVATAALLQGTPASEILGPVKDGSVVLEHPTGTFEANVGISQDGGALAINRAGIIRTARKLMDGTVFPREY